MKCSPLMFALITAACSGDRQPPEPPPEPTEPFEDPVTSNIVSGAVGATGPVMQNSPAMNAEATQSTTGNGGTLGLAKSDSSAEGPHGPEAVDGFGGVGAMTGASTLGGNNGGRPRDSVSSDGKIR